MTDLHLYKYSGLCNFRRSHFPLKRRYYEIVFNLIHFIIKFFHLAFQNFQPPAVQDPAIVSYQRARSAPNLLNNLISSSPPTSGTSVRETGVVEKLLVSPKKGAVAQNWKQALTLCILMDSIFWFDTINLG